MNEPRQTFKQPSSHVRSKLEMTTRTPIAPPAFRMSAVPKVLQTKMHNAPHAGHSRPAMASSSGVVQANVVGGNHALQARLNLWNTRLTRGASMTIGQVGNANSARAIGPANGP